MLSAWLLILIAALIVLGFSSYYQVRQRESDALAREALAQEQLQAAEEALRQSRSQLEALQYTPVFPDPPEPLPDLGSQVVSLRRTGKPLSRIAQELGLPISAVETLLALHA